MWRSASLVWALLTTLVDSAKITFKNQCGYHVELYDNHKTVGLARHDAIAIDASGPGLMWRNGVNPEATCSVAESD